MERLQKIMAQAGIASRRKCEEIILNGRVSVNGSVVTELGYKVDATNDQIEVDGRTLQREQKRYILFYKPTGVITSVTDPQGRPVVNDFFSKTFSERLFPVGRLDYDTEGLLIMTNDGKLTHALTHPSHEWNKTYETTVKGIISEESIERLRRGVMLEDGMTYPALVKRLHNDQGGRLSLIEMTIHEGRNRQVRRMCDAVGHPVIKLLRTRIGFLTIGQLEPGDYRELTPDEIAQFPVT